MRYFVFGLALLLGCSYGMHSSAQTKGEGWKLYYFDESGDRYYYDKGSVETPQRGTVVVWQKITEISSGEELDKSVTHLRLNCRQRSYEILVDATNDRAEMKAGDAAGTQKEKPYKGELQVDSKLRALFENVCPF